ncbi:MAG: alpha-hydroxy-acid oxidizing protein [Gemmatimonadetes bacterium]|nr:MAG: alpha-hydroxy-acid oxidizing protein [Gemmatimonadota bacterium]
MELPTNPDELEARARERLPEPVYHYYAGGAEDERTLAANVEAFRSVFLRPRVLVDVAGVDPSVELFGRRLALPVLLAPTAFQKLADPEGEAATARAAGRVGTVMVASSLSTLPIEAIARAATGPLWLQLYVFRNRALAEALVARAEAAGVEALCLTVTVPVQGNRERDRVHGFGLPEGLTMANFEGAQARFPDAAGSSLEAFIASQFDPSLTWDALAWLRSLTALPVVVKGVQTGEDARLAVEHGAAGVIVSNHGGRQLDGARATLHALPEVAEAVDGRVPVLVDGGVRRGVDVLVARALGARAVLIGRPYLWGLAAAGEAGVEHVLTTFRDEVARALALVGRRNLEEVDRSLLAGAP